jgi:hypothetical protein
MREVGKSHHLLLGVGLKHAWAQDLTLMQSKGLLSLGVLVLSLETSCGGQGQEGGKGEMQEH